MRRFLRFLLLKPVLWASQKFSSKPERNRIFKALNELYAEILAGKEKKGLILDLDIATSRFIILSDQHKGARNGADDFMMAEPNYLAALEQYNKDGFTFISLGDNEELWENTLGRVKKFNVATFEAEKKFIARGAFIKIFGNHDLYWANDPLAWWQLRKIYDTDLRIHEGVVLSASRAKQPFHIFCTHGHQGDAQSDGNWFSKFFVARIWAPAQAYLRINPNTAAYNDEKKTLHNEIMYDWSSQQTGIALLTGHTHQPVFESLTHIERLYRKYQLAQASADRETIAGLYSEISKREREFATVSVDYMKMKPSYFNSGCCCFNDGDITGIEIADGFIRLVKWTKVKDMPGREVLEEAKLEELSGQL